MALSNYNELKTALSDWGKRGDADGKLDTFIAMCEAEMWHGVAMEGLNSEPLRIRGMETRATGNLSGRTLALPSDFLESRKLRLTTNPPRELTFRVTEALTIDSTNGIPTDYTITDQIEFNRTPDGTYGYELTYFQTLTALSSSNQTNAVITNHPNVYLYGSLAHYFDWAQNEGQAAKYRQMFVSAIKNANKSSRKGRYPSAKSMKREAPTP